MFTYDIYSNGKEVTLELSDYPNKMAQCLHVQFDFYPEEMNEEIDTTIEVPNFITPDMVEFANGLMLINGTAIYNS